MGKLRAPAGLIGARLSERAKRAVRPPFARLIDLPPAVYGGTAGLFQVSLGSGLWETSCEARSRTDRGIDLNRNKKHWDRSNHGASRGKAIIIIIPVFPAPPVVEPMYQCCLVVRPAKADAFSGRQSHQGKSQTPCSLDGREERNQ